MCVYVSHCVLFKGLSKLVHARIMNLWPAGEGGGNRYFGCSEGVMRRVEPCYVHTYVHTCRLTQVTRVR